jgi:site-specific DNA-cytosine methylase
MGYKPYWCTPYYTTFGVEIMTGIKALVSHSYIGTLLEAAQQLNIEVIASQEAAGFGSDIQKYNWPSVPIIDKRANWLGKEAVDNATQSGTAWFMIANPPCAGGSMVTPSHARGGLDNPTSAFHVTHDYMKYAFSLRPPIIAIESVPGTLKIAGDDLRKIRDESGPEYGIAFVLDNSCHHGCLSIRKRLWHLYFRKDLFPNGLQWIRYVNPVSRSLREALDIEDGTPDHGVAPTFYKQYEKFKTLWTEMTPGMYANGYLRKSGRWDLVPPEMVKTKTNGEKFVFYESIAAKRLAWDELAPTITGSTFLIHPDGTRPLTSRELLRINGMPDSFRFPPNINVNKHVMYIGKAVTLGITKWVMFNISGNLTGFNVDPDAAVTVHTLSDGDTLDCTKINNVAPVKKTRAVAAPKESSNQLIPVTKSGGMKIPTSLVFD